MNGIKDFIDDNKAAAVVSLLTIIAFIIGIIIICFGAKDTTKNKEKKVLEENTYTMYFKTDSIIKIIFREGVYKCGDKVCSDYTERVVSQELINEQAKLVYENINIKNKDLKEAISIILKEATDKNQSYESIQLISNWTNRYSEEDFKNMLKEQLNTDIIPSIIFEFQDELDEQGIIENAIIKSYTITFDSNLGSSVSSQIVRENELAIMPENPTRPGYVFVDWQFNNRTFNFETKITRDYTLIAKWRREPTVSTTSSTSTTKKTTAATTQAANTGNETQAPTTPNPPENENPDENQNPSTGTEDNTNGENQ